MSKFGTEIDISGICGWHPTPPATSPIAGTPSHGLETAVAKRMADSSLTVAGLYVSLFAHMA